MIQNITINDAENGVLVSVSGLRDSPGGGPPQYYGVSRIYERPLMPSTPPSWLIECVDDAMQRAEKA